ncbi:MAG: ABC transporter ATP-binding protein [Actinomycetota bacterium]|nr:ABC transporter ATP-binding protein [Actinomycetota bacterium]
MSDERPRYSDGPGARIELDNVSKNYGPVCAVAATNLQIGAGEFITFLGPSGCGKTTTLNIVAGLETASSGTVTIGGIDVTHVPPQARDLAMVFQNYALYPHKSVFDNIAFPLRLRRRKNSKDHVVDQVNRVAVSLGLRQLLGRMPAELSGGQRQRVALARAIVRDPRVCLFDEPLSNLDNQLRVQMRTELKELHQRVGATMLYVTHDQSEAMVLSDRIVVMNEGAVQQCGTPLELYRSPSNTFVAGFLGERGMNLARGALTRSVDGLQFRTSGIQLGPDVLRRFDLPDGDYTAGFWPEDLHPCAESEAHVKGVIRTVELLGHSAIAGIETGDRRLSVEVPPGFRGKPGEVLFARIVTPNLQMFGSDGSNTDLTMVAKV